jgi:hypothetical protein
VFVLCDNPQQWGCVSPLDVGFDMTIGEEDDALGIDVFFN